MNRGLLIVFEGIDGSGKTTQRRLLASRLTSFGIGRVELAQPSQSLAGRALRACIGAHLRLAPERELALFIRDRREQARAVISPLLDQGVVVLLDRHYLSSVAYQGALGLDPEVILHRCLRVSPVADLTLLFDVSPAEAVARIRREREADPFERLEYLTRVRELYHQWADRIPSLLVLDAARDAESLAERVWLVVHPFLLASGIVDGSKPVFGARGIPTESG